MLGMGGGMVEDLTGPNLKGGLTAAVVFEIGILMTLISADCAGNASEIGILMMLISGDCAGNASEITDMIGQMITDTIITTPTGPSKTRTGQTC